MTEGADRALLRRRAMDLLARREHSRSELLQKLQQRLPEALPGQLQQVIEQLSAEGLQSDQRFAGSFVRQRQQRGYGPLLVRQQLRQLGVAETDVDAAMQDPETEWKEVLLAVLQRRCAGALPQGAKELQKLQAYCYRRGFDADSIRRALRDLGAA